MLESTFRFPNYDKVCIVLGGVINADKGNKPPEINGFDKGHNLSPPMKAMRMWCFLKYLPLIVGDKIPYDDEQWLFMLHLSESVDLIFAPQFTSGMISYLQEVIAEHLEKFKELFSYGENAVSLKPKHHFLVHLQTIIRQSGPLMDIMMQVSSPGVPDSCGRPDEVTVPGEMGPEEAHEVCQAQPFIDQCILVAMLFDCTWH